LKQDKELVLLLNKTNTDSEGSGEACMMVVQTGDLAFISISGSSSLNQWELEDLKVLLISSINIDVCFKISEVYVRTYASPGLDCEPGNGE